MARAAENSSPRWLMSVEDFLYQLKDRYRVAPALVKRSIGQVYALLPLSLRYGRVLSDAQRLLEESQWWTKKQHARYQLQRLQDLAYHAYHNVPFYRRVFDQLRLTPGSIRSLADWQRLPLLSREDVQRNKLALVARNCRDRALPVTTGGSTGAPLELFWERGRTRSLERAFMWRQWDWAGFRHGQRSAVVRGQTVRGALWHYDPIDHQLFVNAYQLSDDNCERIVSRLRRFRPRALHGYPATLTVLATWMARNNVRPIEGLAVLLCGSENLYPSQKGLLAEAFAARPYSWYGHGESCCLAGYCEREDYYHVYSEYGYTELVDESGQPLSWLEGQRGEIVATSFINSAMPLLRYRTGDVAVVGPEATCGRNYPLLASIEGRQQEYILTEDGRAIALTGLVFGQHWRAFARIRKLQFEQSVPGEVVVRLAVHPAFVKADEVEILAKIQSCVPGLKVSLEYVEDIATTERGKHLFVKQRLNVGPAWAGEVWPRSCG